MKLNEEENEKIKRRVFYNDNLHNVQLLIYLVCHKNFLISINMLYYVRIIE